MLWRRTERPPRSRMLTVSYLLVSRLASFWLSGNKRLKLTFKAYDFKTAIVDIFANRFPRHALVRFIYS